MIEFKLLIKNLCNNTGFSLAERVGAGGESPLLENLPKCTLSLSVKIFSVLCLYTSQMILLLFYGVMLFLQCIGIICFKRYRFSYKLNVCINLVMFLAKWDECRKPYRSSEIILGAGCSSLMERYLTNGALFS